MVTVAEAWNNCFSKGSAYWFPKSTCNYFVKCVYPSFDNNTIWLIALITDGRTLWRDNNWLTLVVTPGGNLYYNKGTNALANFEQFFFAINRTAGDYNSYYRASFDDYWNDTYCSVSSGISYEYVYPTVSVPEYCTDSLDNWVISVSCTPPDSPAPILPTNCRTGENLSGELVVECEDWDLVCPVGTYLSWSGTGEAQCLAIQGWLPKTNDTAAFTLSEETVSYVAVIILVLAGVAFLLRTVRRIWK